MGCATCSNGEKPRGCRSNGACATTGCNKLEVFDWLANIELPGDQTPFDIVEVRFKNSRKVFYRNIKNFRLNQGDVVVVESSPGYDIGVVSISGELARIQLKKKTQNFKPHEARKIFRIANQEDIDKWIESREREKETMFRARVIADRLKLNMKISDVEYQGDGTKATFYYTAEDRVDFRQLIKDLADAFKIRIEMRQIGARQESGRLGGIGSCGRELCCSTWLTDFRSVSTAAARYQQLALNPQKLAGQCGKLKCCLNYELDMYIEGIKSFPSTDIKLETKKGRAYHVKTDVFKRTLWYAYEPGSEGPPGLIPLIPERAHEIIEMNKKGKKPEDLNDYIEEVLIEEPDYTNVVGQDSLNRFEHIFKKKKKKKGKKGSPGGANRNQNNPQNTVNQGNRPNQGQKNQGGGNKPKGKRFNKNKNQQKKNNNP
ncbi:MAG: regulatory iron-sulfur-containing complex subunit RicT [Crocinitomicaceae bacterium]